MHLLSFGTIFCLCLVIVKSEDDGELQEEGRYIGVVKKSGNNEKLRIGSEGSMKMGILSSFNLSTGVKGISCRHNRCRHYGNEANANKGAPNWEMRVGNIRYLCYNKDVRDCPQFEEGKYTKFKGEAPKKTLNFYQMVVPGKVYLCQADSLKECPKVPLHENGWERVTREKVNILERGNITIMCLASDKEKCYAKFGHDNWQKGDDLGDYTLISWYIVDEGIKYYCKATEKENCHGIDGFPGSYWRRYCSGNEVEECEKGKWELIVDGVTIICVADVIDDCKKTRAGDWKPSSRKQNRSGKPKNTNWYIEGVGGAIFYCGEPERAECYDKFSVEGGRKWEEAPPDDDLYELQDNLWERRIKGKTIICATTDVKFCKAVHKGKWKPSGRSTNDDGVPENSRRVMFPGEAKIYCDVISGKPCPKIKKITWGPDKPEGESETNQWELTVDGKTIKCVAHDMDDCKRIVGGYWKHCNESNEDSKWWIPVKEAKVYCDEKSYENCPNVQGRHTWEKNPGNPDKPAPMWQLKDKGKKLICMAFNAKDCRKSHKGQWKRRSGARNAIGAPDKAKWWLIVGKVRVYCDKNSPKACPKIDKGGDDWHEILGGSEESESQQIWELGVGGEIFVCIAYNVEDCKKFREGVWKPNKDRSKDANGVPEGANWWVPVGKSKVYCNSKSSKSCPILGKGEEWQKVPGGAGEESIWTNVPNDDREVDAGRIAPGVIGGGRFKQSQNDDSILLCYDDDSKDCPEELKWNETKNEVGEKVNHIISRKNIWELKIRGTHVVCIADELFSCKPKGGGWNIIAGMKAGLWKSTYEGVVVYCEAARKTNCPEEFGDWDLVSEEQWIQKTLDPNKKWDMWRMVTFGFNAFCDAEYKDKCPKLKDHFWHKVFGDNIDFKAYGKVINFKQVIKNSLYYCKAVTEDACPELPYSKSWEKLIKKATLEETLTFFEDIAGFEDNCRSGICKIAKKSNDDPFD